MATCYRCGAYIAPDKPHVRRRVKTGESLGSRSRRVSTVRLRTTFGMRIVCQRCAHTLDLHPLREEVTWLFKLGLALAALFFLFLVRTWR